MQTLIESLVKLQTIEIDRVRLEQELRALPSELSQAEAALNAAEKQSADVSAAIGHEDSLRTRLDREIDAHRQKAARFRVQLDSVTTHEQASAMEHEIRFESAEAAAWKMKNTQALSARKPTKPRLPNPATRWNCWPPNSRVFAPAWPPASKSWSPNLLSGCRREAVRTALDPDWLARFERIAAARKGTGIARAENQQCTGCRMGVRPQTWNQLREGELLTCDSCSRFLYWDPAIHPSEQRPLAGSHHSRLTGPDPEAIPSACRAVRKPRQTGA